MRKSRLILKSVIADLGNLFGGQQVLGRPYNVYGEQELRAGTRPTFPYIYICDFGVVFQKEQLPLIVVQPSVSLVTAELGGTSFHVNLALHLFANDRGQRYDISSAIMESVDSLVMFSADGIPIDAVNLLGDSETGRLWSEEYSSVGRDYAIEGSLANWITLTTSFMTNMAAAEQFE